MVNPLPNAFPSVVISGFIPKCFWAPPGDTLNPVTTSSKISGTLFSFVIFLMSERKLFSGKINPIFARIGSTITPATSLFFLIVFSRSSALLYWTTRVFFDTSFRPPSDTEMPLCADPEPAFTSTES